MPFTPPPCHSRSRLVFFFFSWQNECLAFTNYEYLVTWHKRFFFLAFSFVLYLLKSFVIFIVVVVVVIHSFICRNGQGNKKKFCKRLLCYSINKVSSSDQHLMNAWVNMEKRRMWRQFDVKQKKLNLSEERRKNAFLGHLVFISTNNHVQLANFHYHRNKHC